MEAGLAVETAGEVAAGWEAEVVLVVAGVAAVVGREAASLLHPPLLLHTSPS